MYFKSEIVTSDKATLKIGSTSQLSPADRGNFMVQHCPMVKGPCRGNSCDFWARIKIRKLSLDELVLNIREFLVECKVENSKSIDEAIREYWAQIGIRNMDRVCREEPDLCTKMMDAEVLAKQ